ncbi:MAG: GFA family protein, partial [Chloroflexota bacterium]
MNKGKCLCEKVQFQVTGSFGEVRYCHCSQCRRMTGSAFSANAKVSKGAWELTQGEEHIREFEHKPGIFRGFCSNCGSPVYSRLAWDPDHMRVRLGTFDK